MTYKGICNQDKAPRPAGGSGRYSAGQRRCVICEMFIKWDRLLCPCCGCRLRAKPRNTVDRRRTAMDLSNASFNNKSQLLLGPLSVDLLSGSICIQYMTRNFLTGSTTGDNIWKISRRSKYVLIKKVLDTVSCSKIRR